MFNCKVSILASFLVLVLYMGRAVYSAENPLGIVTAVNDADATVEFDNSVYLQAGTMVAMYGGGSVKLYPLTDEVAVKDLEHLATGQIIGKGGNLLKARFTWKKPDGKIGIGMSVVPLSNEAAPNSPPVQFGKINDVSTAIQTSVSLALPIKDPDGDEVSYSWELSGEKGRVGFLEAHLTRIPENIWYAPGVESQTIATVTATDSFGQSLTCSMNLSTSMWGDNWRARELTVFRSVGDDVSANSIFLSRDRLGYWWSITEDAVFTISPGWFKSQPFSMNTSNSNLSPSAMATFNDLFHFVGKNSGEVSVFDRKGVLKRTYGIQSNPTDIVIGDDGIVYVADQSLGGVQVYESNGMFRATLGRGGEGNNYFSELTRVALDHKGQLYALDRNTGTVHRFGRFQERLPSWNPKLVGKEVVKDVSWHPQGRLLILLNNGRIVRLDDQGRRVKPDIEPAIGRLYFDPIGVPESMYVDLSGETFVTYPKVGIIARYTKDGDLYGIRGAPFWGLSQFAMDSSGGGCARYGNSTIISVLDPEGWITRQIGADKQKMGSLKIPSKFALSPDGATLAVLDSDKTHIVRFDLAGSSAPVIFGQPGKNEGQFATLNDVVFDDYDHVYVLDSKLCRISIFDRNGQFLFSFGQKGKSEEDLRKPTLLAVRPGGQTAFVCDGYEIKKFALDYPKRKGTYSASAGGRGKGPGQLLEPVAIACDRQGLLYIVDSGRRDIQAIDFRGKNAIGTYAKPYKKFGVQKVSEMALNVDGKPYLIDAGRFVGVTWED